MCHKSYSLLITFIACFGDTSKPNETGARLPLGIVKTFANKRLKYKAVLLSVDLRWSNISTIIKWARSARVPAACNRLRICWLRAAGFHGNCMYHYLGIIESDSCNEGIWGKLGKYS